MAIIKEATATARKQAIIRFALLGVLLVGLISAVILTQSRQRLETEAANLNQSSVVRGAPADGWADLVIGQPDFHQAVPREITNFKVAGPGGVVVDRSVRPNRLYIYDGINSRVLGFRSLGFCDNDPSRECSADSDCDGGSSCSIAVAGRDGSKKADIVIGQPGFTSSACNGDGTFQSYPNRAKASQTSLCSIPQDTLSLYEYGSFASMDVDSEGNLYVADFFNNRVLQFLDPFTTDAVADGVWGQENFENNECNKGGSPDATTLCFPHVTPNNPLVGAVDIDPSGNLWVADSNNNRVLRFPRQRDHIRSAADLVLGQQTFSNNSFGSGLGQLYIPSAVRVHETGDVYVADTENNRILLYHAPIISGMAGELFAGQFKKPTGVEFDIPTSDPTSGGIWVSDTNNYQLVLFSEDGIPKKTLFKDTYRPDGTCGNPGMYCPSNGGVDLCNMCDARGSIGITSDGDILAASSIFNQDVHYYKHPIPTLNPGHPYPASAQFFFPPVEANYLSDRGFDSPRSIAKTQSQLIIADSRRILYWNTSDPLTLSNGAPADGVVGVSDFTTFVYPHYARIAANDQYLWAIRDTMLEQYALPLTFAQMPTRSIQFSSLKYINNEGEVGTDMLASDIATDKDETHLWIALPRQDRVIRVLIPENEEGDYLIDVIVGGDDIPPIDDRWHRPCPPPDRFCSPGGIALDHRGHLYVSDYGLENEGDAKFFRFDERLFPSGTTQLITVDISQAAQTFTNVYGWKPAFDSRNRMVLGFAAFTPGSRFPYIYPDVTTLSSLEKLGELNDWFSQAYASFFDEQDRLYVADLNRGRVLVYDQIPDVTATPTPEGNATPAISTQSLPDGKYNREYSASVLGYDDDIGDTLTVSFHGLPAGIDVISCIQGTMLYKKYILCDIGGSTRQPGTHDITVTIADDRGGESSVVLPLKISRR